MGHYEKQKLTPRHKAQLTLILRLVDDKFGIFIPTSGDKETQTQYDKYLTGLNAVISLSW